MKEEIGFFEKKIEGENNVKAKDEEENSLKNVRIKGNFVILFSR